MLDTGDTLTCVQGANNNLGSDIAGKEAKVDRFATIDGAERRVGDAAWIPAK